MNPIAIWCKFKDYRDWCYQYRIPNESEFIEGFKYEFAYFTITTGDIIEVFWNKYTVGDGENKRILSHLKSYLEAGYIRVKKADERLNKENNQMIFYYEATKENKKKYIVIPAENQMDGWNKILSIVLSPQIKAGKFKEGSNKSFDLVNEIELNGEKGYTLTSAGYEITEPLLFSPSEIIYYNCTEDDWKKAAPKFVNKKEKSLWQEGWKYFKQYFHRKESIIPKHQTIVDTKSKYPSRRDPITSRYLPVHTLDEIKNNLYNHQPEKSENRLVCIATKDRKEFRRTIFKEASLKVSNIHSDGKEWEYISKKEFRALSRPTPGLSFTKPLVKGKKPIPNKSSNKVAKCKRHRKHPNCQQGVKHPKVSIKFEVSFLRNFKEGSAEFVYQVLAKNEEQAIYKGGKRAIAEGADLAYFKPVVKRLDESNTNLQPKRESLTKRLIMPHIVDLPTWKDKLGNIIPWTKKVTKITTKEERAVGAGIFKEDREEIKTYTKYEVLYHRYDLDFKKKPKKWKHPIKDNRKR